jgi:hypothetical protein
MENCQFISVDIVLSFHTCFLFYTITPKYFANKFLQSRWAKRCKKPGSKEKHCGLVSFGVVMQSAALKYNYTRDEALWQLTVYKYEEMLVGGGYYC